jgi:hypothetical protein
VLRGEDKGDKSMLPEARKVFEGIVRVISLTHQIVKEASCCGKDFIDRSRRHGEIGSEFKEKPGLQQGPLSVFALQIPVKGSQMR